ncbi:MAG TPA: trypsin-like peptidase domain-containing protein [Micromonospora sp.]|nr:trypsin-like peptidase domain-containing protein [Micromonospora sp.]
MSEHESNLPRQEAAPDGQPDRSTGETSHGDLGQPGSAAPPAISDAPAPTSPAAPQDSSLPPSSGLPHPAPMPAAGPYPPSPRSPYGPGQPESPYGAGQPGQPYPVSSGWTGHAHQYPYGGTPTPAPSPHLGGPPPVWPGYPMAEPAPRPGRFGKLVAAGAAALVLMAGSGIAGGIAALALKPSGGPTYTAAPIINSDDLPGIAAAVQDSVVSISAGAGEGSGVVLSPDGFILTNNHVVAQGGPRVEVVFANGKMARAKVIGTDPRSDLAVIKAEGVSGLTVATFGDSDAMRVGDTVLALGSPLGLQGSVTAGIISAKNRTIRAGDDRAQANVSISGLLQTDAPINPGNSGGALVNTRGEVIGINTAIATAGQGTGNIGVGFAIPSNKAKAVAEALKKGEKVSHPRLGVEITTAEGGGALVGQVVPGTPAEEAGLRKGDIITRFGDKVIDKADDLTAAVQARKVGDRVDLTYQRDGAEEQVTVTLAEAS